MFCSLLVRRDLVLLSFGAAISTFGMNRVDP